MWEKILLLLLGAALGSLIQQYRIARSEEISLINEHIKDVEKFCDSAQAYWLKTPTTQDEDRSLAAKVRAAHFATTLLYEEIATICADKAREYKGLSQSLFEVATGGDFESAQRIQDPARAMDVQVATTALVHLLRLRRPYIVSLYRLWNEGLIRY